MLKRYFIGLFLLGFAFFANAQADAKFKEIVHDFGEVESGSDTLWYEFSYTNTGNEPLEIRDVKTSCDCTLAEWPKTPLQPGKTAIIRGGFKTEGKSGVFEKNIIVILNTSPATNVLTIKGKIGTPPPSTE
jgi:hypothetical protein